MAAENEAASSLITLIVEATGFYRELLILALRQAPEFRVLHHHSADEAFQEEAGPGSTVVVIDLDQGPRRTYLERATKLRQAYPDLGVVLMSDQPMSVLGAFGSMGHSAGWSYLLKSSLHSIDAFIRTVRAAAEGLVVLNSELLSPSPGNKDQDPPLTPRQRQILDLMADGWTNTAIAQHLGMSVKSVENQINHIYQTLGVSSENRSRIPRVQAVLKLLRERF